MKRHLSNSQLMSKLKEREQLLINLAVSKVVVSAVLVRKEDVMQFLIYYISKILLGAETHYPQLEKLALAHVVAF